MESRPFIRPISSVYHYEDQALCLAMPLLLINPLGSASGNTISATGFVEFSDPAYFVAELEDISVLNLAGTIHVQGFH